MHPSKSTPALRCLIAAGILALPLSARAQAYSWSNNGDGINMFGSGSLPDGYLTNWSPNLETGSFPAAGDFTIDAGAGPFLDGSDLALGSAVTIHSLNFTGNYITGMGIGGAEDGTITTVPLTFATAGSTILSLTGNTDFSRVTFRATAPIVLNYTGLSTVNVAASGTLQLNSVVSGSGGLIKIGAGTLGLGAVNTFTGKLQINEGTVAITAGTQLGSPAATTTDAVTINGGTLSYSGLATTASVANLGYTIGASGGTINVATGSTFNVNGTLTGSGSLTKTGGGMLALGTGTRNMTGDLAIYGGGVSAAGFTRIGSSSGGSFILDGGKLTLITLSGAVRSAAYTTRKVQLGESVGEIETTTTASRTFGGIVTDITDKHGVLRKTGTGTLGLIGTVSHTGGTLVNAGTLVFANTALGGASSIAGVTVASSGTLDGNGQVNGNSTFLAGSRLLVTTYVSDSSAVIGYVTGSAYGTMTFNGNLDISGAASGAASMFLDLSATVYDKIVLSAGVLTIGDGLLGLADFSFGVDSATFGDGVYTLISTTQTVVGSLLSSNTTGTIGGRNAVLSLNDAGNSIILTVGASAVPEPSTWAAIFGGAALLVAVSRRAKRTGKLA